MEALLSKKEKIAAVLILVAISIFVIYLVGIALEKKLFTKTSTYHTIIKNGEGLRPGVEISFLGVKIGEVGNIEILSDNTLRVDIKIYRQYTDWITSKTDFIIERRYGIGEKKVKVVNDKNGTKLPVGSYINSIEKLDIVELFYRADFVKLVSTIEKTVFIAGAFIEQVEKNGRIEHIGQVIDNILDLLENIEYIVSESKSPLLEILRDPNLKRSFVNLNNFLNNEDMKVILKELAKMSKDQHVVQSIDAMGKVLSDKELKNAISGANAFFNNADLYSVIKESNSIVKSGEVNKIVNKLSDMITKLDQMLPESPEIREAFGTTVVELSNVLKRMQKTWFMDEKTKEAFEELVVVLRAMQKTWLLEDETREVLKEQRQVNEK